MHKDELTTLQIKEREGHFWHFQSTGYWGVGVNQAYSRLSTTHGYITDCKLDSVVYVGVCV